MKTFSFASLVLLGLLVLGRPALGQMAAPPFDVAAAAAGAKQQYANAFLSHTVLYSGPEYFDYSKPYHACTGHQYFLVPERQLGSVVYNQHAFSNVLLSYDVVLDQVVLSPPQSPLTLRLINEKVDRFSIGPHRFTRLVADSASRNVIRTGYYEVLVDSTVQVLAKRSKRMQEHISQMSIDVEFIPADRLFIRQAGRYYAVASKSSVMHLFADHSKEMQKYSQEHKLRFSKAQREASIVQLVAYYDSLPRH
jgi:hypothetical protein